MAMNFKTLAALCAVSMMFTGCNGDDADNGSNVTASDGESPSENNTVNTQRHNSASPSEANGAAEFSSAEVSVSGKGISANGTVVTVSEGGIYAVSGECGDGKIIIDASDSDVTLVLNQLDLTSGNNSVIECTKAKSLTICAAEGTENVLADNADYTLAAGEDEPDAAVFSKSDLAFTGKGKIKITGNYKDGIKGKDGFYIEGGNIEITAADDGITARDFAVISDGEITITAANDGLKTTNDKDATMGYIVISGGKLNICAGGDEADAEITVSNSPFDWDKRSDDSTSKKGIKAVGNIKIEDGEINVKSADDSVHSNADIEIIGGNLSLSSCDDAIHADENLTVSGGEINVSKSYEGLEGKNIDIGGGKINIKAADDGLNAAGGDNGAFFGFNADNGDYYISISGGEITVNADGDGIDSNGTVAMSGGYVTVFGPTSSGNGALDYEKSFAVSGGTLIALGSREMAQAPSTLAQPCLSIYADVKSGSKIEVRNGDTEILSVVTEKNCVSLIFTSDKFKSGEEYGIYADGTLLSSVTATDGISGDAVGGQSFGPGGGNRPGGNMQGGDMPGGDMPNGDRPGGNMPGGEIGPGGNIPGGDFSGGDAGPGRFERGDRGER